MFKTGFVQHYVKEYTESEFSIIFSLIVSAARNNTLEPKITNLDQALANLIKNLPVGTAICKFHPTNKSNETSSPKTVICYPFFSSHMQLPLKHGETVWFFEDEKTFFDDGISNTLPALSVRNYWISRKIGSKISEDLNFTHIQRDTLINDQSRVPEVFANNNFSDESTAEKKAKKEYIKSEKEIIDIPDFKNKSQYVTGFVDLIPDIEKLYQDSINNTNFANATPRWNSKPYEFTLQGSNNSLINLTKNKSEEESFLGKGAIDIVAGRHSISKYREKSEDDFLELTEKSISNISVENKEKIGEIKVDLLNPFLTIKNNLGYEENIKNQEFYLRKNYKSEKLEGEANFENDASRIYLSEFDQVDNFLYYDTSFVENQIFPIQEEESKFEISEEKDYLNDTTITFSNFNNESLSLQNKLLPTVLVKSNNIRIISRKQKESEFSKINLEEGSIRLIKESNNFLNYSHVNLESNGNVLIDGNSILVGNFQKELLKNKIIESEDVFLTRDDIQKLESLRGNGTGVILGYNPDFSEPLVLGETLKAIISELINLNITMADEMKLIAEALQTHIHIGIPGSGVSGIPQKPTPFIDYSTTSHNDLVTKYGKIKNNLKDMLSKFAKSS